MLDNLIKGVSAYFKVFSLVAKYNLYKYFIYTGLIGLITGACLSFLAYLSGDWIGNFIINLLGVSPESWINNVIDWVLRLGLFVGMLLVFKYIIIVVCGPVLSAMSQKMEHGMTGFIPKSTTLKSNIDSTFKGVRMAIRNFSREMMMTIALLILSFIPGVNLISTPLLLIIQAYYAGFGNHDIFAERHFNFRDRVAFGKDNRMMNIGNGSIFLLLLSIPVLGWIFAPTFAVIAGTYNCVNELNEA